MLHLVQSNKMELLLASLLKTLAEETFQEDNSDPANFDSLLQPDTVLVQSPGMSQWLKINIAQTLNIAANIEFPLPSSYIWKLYDRFITGLPKESAFNKNHLTWKILQLLPTLLDEVEFSNVKRYLQQDETDSKELLSTDVVSLKKWQLAAKVADVYDQYLMYRPDWIAQWETGENKIKGADVSQQPWQPVLWRKLVEFTGELGESLWHRANMHEALIESLKQPQEDTSKPLYVFGISAMPSQQLEILQAIAANREVYIYWFNPSHHFWGDVVDTRRFQKQQLSLFDEEGEPAVINQERLKKEQALSLIDVGNPLLASWGKPGQDFLSMVGELDVQQEDIFQTPEALESPDSSGSEAAETESVDLLSWVQKEVYELSFRNSRQPLKSQELLTNTGKFPKRLISPKDNSIEIHAVHSKLRELEVLKDQICDWFENGQIDSVGEIIVMMPDVASYAPLIDAVFSRPLHIARKNGESFDTSGIPFAISDRTQAQEDTLVQSFLTLMGLEFSRLTLTNIFELIKTPEIADRYQLTTEHIDVLHHWCANAGIRWGWSGETKQKWELPEESQNTWLFGLKRLISGYAQSGITDFENVDILPFSEVEGQVTQALGQFLAFLEDISRLVEFCEQAHSLRDKVEEALLVIDCFYQVDSDNEYRIQSLKESIAELKHHQFQFDGLVSQQVFVAALKEKLNQSGVGQRFLAGRLNFCTLMPMRSIPFKHVCILGLNETDYPRQTIPISFDLMTNADVRKGDRSRRLDDRYLFLEALLSARQKLYLSYVGRSDRNNEVRAPSILVSELIDYCQQSVCFEHLMEDTVELAEEAIAEHLLTVHPLQPWSEAYFQSGATEQIMHSRQNASLFSYDVSMLSLAKHEQPEQYADFFQLDPQLIDQLCQSSHSGELFPGESSQSEGVAIPEAIELDSVLQFFRNPVKSWVKSVWKTQFPPLLASSQDQEPLFLDSLERYKVTQAMLLGAASDEVVSQLSLSGSLPIGNLKDIELQYLYARVESIQDKLDAQFGEQLYRGGEQSIQSHWVTCDIEFAQSNISISAPLTLLNREQLVLFRPGKLSANDRLRTWLSWCVFCASGASLQKTSENDNLSINQEAKAWFLAEDKVLSYDLLTVEDAKRHLTPMLSCYLLGQSQCLPFFPTTSLNWAEHQDIEKAVKAYSGNDFVGGDGQEVHNQRIYPLLSDVWLPFTQLADFVFQPILSFGRLS